jgi:hypothetical protein
VSRPAAGFDGSRCALGRLGGPLCDPGAIDDRLRSFLATRVSRAGAALASAESATTAKKRGRAVAKAQRLVDAMAKRATRAAKKRKGPLPAACRDRLLSEIQAVRDAISTLRH